ncbi:hypothetical protein E7681_06540 [Thalassobius vesicularis]|uniref:Uncharacterized protein n=1 Tax=Thalassobius vesicularis TaxID=1294297 RepID=A0A4S3M999_9RHOB|nr:hypothetical protein [Thalassobius vesicularis]THD74626.1 hypothetical protein E7681_06540 [Thalassobius vesicularis]
MYDLNAHAPGQALQDARALTRATMRFFGVVLGMVALGLWLVPGAFDDAAEALMRGLMSALFLGIAVGLWGAGQTRFDDEFHLDLENHQLRHMMRGQDGIARLRKRYRFDDLDEITLQGGVLMARLTGGREVLRVAVDQQLEPGVMERLRGLSKRPAV